MLLNTNISQQNAEIATLVSRMDSFTRLSAGSTTGDAELADGRVGYNGKTYDNIGDAIREQVSGLHTLVNLSNNAKAFKYFKAAAEEGVTSAEYYLGICYFQGEGTKKDKEQAIKWLRIAAEDGDEDAMNLLLKIDIYNQKLSEYNSNGYYLVVDEDAMKEEFTEEELKASGDSTQVQ